MWNDALSVLGRLLRSRPVSSEGIFDACRRAGKGEALRNVIVFQGAIHGLHDDHLGDGAKLHTYF